MICLNSKGIYFLESLKNLRAITLKDLKKMTCNNKKCACRNANDDLIEQIEEYNIGLEQEVIMLEPRKSFDSCVVGYDISGRVIYCRNKIIKAFMKDGMTKDEAVEYYEYNTLGTFQGMSLDRNPPIFLNK